eukprot:scaffold4584_cov98-Amphora_coffeaeformis.AAC.1
MNNRDKYKDDDDGSTMVLCSPVVGWWGVDTRRQPLLQEVPLSAVLLRAAARRGVCRWGVFFFDTPPSREGLAGARFI